MKKNSVEAVLVIDRSGSMSSIKKSTIDSINEFLNSLRTNGLETKVTLVQFDNKYEVQVDGTLVNLVQDLNESTFVPRGMTALHDAIGKTINTVGERLSKTKEEDRPEKLMFVIITDGFENASHEFDSSKIKSMIAHQKLKYNWNFVFLGANQDAIFTAQQFGIRSDSAISYAANSLGVQNVGASLRNYNTLYYNGGSAKFTEEDRMNAMADADPTVTVSNTATTVKTPVTTGIDLSKVI